MSGPTEAKLKSTDEPLHRRYDVALFDLDGVVYLLDTPVPGVPAALETVTDAGCEAVFVTNNASRAPEEVAGALTRMGITCPVNRVVTSAQAAAAGIAAHCGSGASTFVVGSNALRTAVQAAGLTLVDDPRAAEAVAMGYVPTTNWRDLADITLAARHGAWWMVANLDATLPTPDGPMPGMGALAQAVATALGRSPDAAAGKPEPVIYRTALERVGGERPIMVGDRPDSDIRGANALGLDTLLVFSGVAGPLDAVTLPPDDRPDYLGWTAEDLIQPQPTVTVSEPGAAGCGSWRVHTESGRFVLRGQGDVLSAWRAVCAAAWSAADAGVTRLDPRSPPEILADGEAAQTVLKTA
ncbi:HAD-IIA family hydrolase [Haloglycomyces albus]|uniref:HAD-IIA family hydrolase n=1 Tax=Haloglycomyces albus TaxID=526067 RepID=UPI00046CEC23|nr:HAD-IIA family hydrolase [Haloglycomyces albus]